MANDEQAGGMASDVVKVTGTPPERSVNRRILATPPSSDMSAIAHWRAYRSARR